MMLLGVAVGYASLLVVYGRRRIGSIAGQEALLARPVEVGVTQHRYYVLEATDLVRRRPIAAEPSTLFDFFDCRAASIPI